MISETNLGKIDGFKENHQKFIKPPSYEVMNPMVNLGPSFVNNNTHLKSPTTFSGDILVDISSDCHTGKMEVFMEDFESDL